MTRRPPVRRARGFTLIELLMAIALLSMLLGALFTFVFSMGEIWGRGSDKRLFQQHVSASSRYIETLLRRGALQLVTPAGSAEPYSVRPVRSTEGGTMDLLTFVLPDGDRLFSWPAQPLPEVNVSLGVIPGRGLVLFWQSSLELNADTEPPRMTPVSPFVTRLEYLTYQPETSSWRTDPQLHRNASGTWVLPDRIRLTYAYGTLTTVRELTLPARSAQVPAY